MKTGGVEKRARVKELKAEGKTIDEIMELMSLKRPTIYAYLRPDAPKAKKAAPKPANGDGGSTGLHVTPLKNGSFLVSVPAERLAKVAAALA